MKRLKALILTTLISLTVISQNSSIDSLNKLFAESEHDTTKILLLIEVGDILEFESPDSALFYYKKALNLCERNLKKKINSELLQSFSLLKSKSLRYIGIIFSDKGDFEKSLDHYKKALSLDEKFGDIKGVAADYNNIGLLYYNRGDLEKARNCYQNAVKSFESLTSNKHKGTDVNISQALASCYTNIGSIYDEQCNFDKALEYYFKALKLAEESNYLRGVSACYTNIGIVYQSQEDYKTAVAYFFKAMEIEQELGNNIKLADCYNNIGLAKFEEKNILKSKAEISDNLEESLKYFEFALKLYQELNYKWGLSKCYANIGLVFYEKTKLSDNFLLKKVLSDKAKDYFNNALQLFEELGDKNGIASVLINSGNQFNYLKEFRKAQSSCKKGLETSVETRQLLWKRNACNCLSNAYYGMNMYDSSYFYKVEFINANDSIFSNEKTKVLAELSAKYEDEKKQLLITNLHKKNQIKQAEIEKSLEQRNKQLLVIWFVIGGFIILILFTIILFRLFIQKKKANLLLAGQKQQIQIQNLKLEQANEEINAQMDEIEAQRDLVTVQKNYIEEQKKEITDSINYARRIQEAVFPAGEYAENQFHSFFIIFKPRDIVSGDFHWGIKINDIVIIAVAGCTGHGVPGAFMSMLGISFLNEIVRNKNIDSAGEVLNQLGLKINEALGQNNQDFNAINSGMNISLCIFNKEKMVLQYAGANQPVYIINKDNMFFELYPDEHSINLDDNFNSYKNHETEIHHGDFICMCSDGYDTQIEKYNSSPTNNGQKLNSLKEMIKSDSFQTAGDKKDFLVGKLENLLLNNEQVDDICLIGLII